jgi:large subunit ribosomal protein L31
MKQGIHPEYVETTVRCSCGSTFQTHSTKPSIKLDVCSNCHPFYTGTQRLIDSAGQVERFRRRFNIDK